MASPCGLRASAVGHETGGEEAEAPEAAEVAEGGGATGAVLGTGRRAWSAKERASQTTTQPSFMTPTMRSSLPLPSPGPGV